MNAFEQYTMEIAGVPLLLLSRGPPVRAAKKGTILFAHGLGATKESNLRELERLADAGFLAIGLDAVGHGEHPGRPFQERVVSSIEEAMIGVVVDTLHELGPLLRALLEAGLANPGRVGLCGVSMGGFLGYAAAAELDLAAVVTLLASPLWRSDQPDNPEANLDVIYPCALLSQLAGRDERVDPREAMAFHARLAPHYEHAPERLALVVYPESAHFMREEDWNLAIERTIAWFHRFLTEG